MFANLASIRAKLESGSYSGEYEFQSELYNNVFGLAHDGHFVFYPDLLTLVFDWNRPLSLVSISQDQSSLPEIKVYEDVVSSPSTASSVTHINGVDAAKYIEDTINQAGWNQDVDSAYNSMFFELASPPAGLGVGFFQGGGRIRYVYHGDTTNITFANGTEITLENYARIKVPLTGITDGESMYETFCDPKGYNGAPTSTASNGTAAAPTTLTGYPKPVIITKDSVVAGFYLDGEGYEDIAVIVLLAFESESPAEFQAVVSQFLADAKAAGKTKLVVDFQGNGGGYILQGYDFFRQLFPSVQEDGFSRWKESDSFLAISDVVSKVVANVDPYTTDNPDFVNFYESWYNWRYDLNLTLDPFVSFEDKFGPYVYQDTNYTNIMRWDLNDNLTTTNETFGLGIEIHGYGSLTNLTQPFAAEDIIMLYDGECASTCTIASEMLRIQGGVKSVSMGGRPQEGPIQGVGGVKGSQVLDWSAVLAYNQAALQYGANITTDAQKAALGRYTDLALNRSTAAAVNGRDQILRGNVEDGLPAQFVAEEADCRLYWTLPMVTDMTAVWKAVADAAWNGGKCAYGGLSSSSSSSSSGTPKKGTRDAGDVAGGRVARPIQRHPTTITRRAVSQSEMIKAKQMLKAIQ
jgi:hypothetical protein